MKTKKFTTTEQVSINGKNYVVRNTFRDYNNNFRLFTSKNKNELLRTKDKFGCFNKKTIIKKEEMERAMKSHQEKFDLIIDGCIDDFKANDIIFKYYETSIDANNKSQYLRKWIRTEFFEENYYKELKGSRR